MASELNVLGRRLARLAERRRESRDFTARSLTEGLREVVACFPVYRSYVGDDGQAASEQDREHVAQAVSEAKRRSPTTNPSVFDFIADLLCRTGELDFVRRFQQLTGPVTAKGVEDTAFYRYGRLLSLNEVGGAPDRFGTPVPEFHRMNAERLARWPHALSATSTHDTKRSEDVRARINVLSELPHEWRARLRTWHRLNRRHRTLVDGQPAPDPNEEYFLYQTLLGAWPTEPVGDADYAAFVERIEQHMMQGAPGGEGPRELGAPQSGLRRRRSPASSAAILDRSEPPRPAPGRLRRLIGAIVSETAGNPFLADFRPFQQQIAEAGHVQLARPDPLEARRPRRAGHLPGNRDVGPEPGRPGQPAARGPRAAPGRPPRDPGDARGTGRPTAASSRARSWRRRRTGGSSST